MDHGIRLRSDSNGSMKSAFYQGRIVSSSSQNADISQGIAMDHTGNRNHHHVKVKGANKNYSKSAIPPATPPPPPATSAISQAAGSDGGAIQTNFREDHLKEVKSKHFHHPGRYSKKSLPLHQTSSFVNADPQHVNTNPTQSTDGYMTTENGNLSILPTTDLSRLPTYERQQQQHMVTSLSFQQRSDSRSGVHTYNMLRGTDVSRTLLPFAQLAKRKGSPQSATTLPDSTGSQPLSMTSPTNTSQVRGYGTSRMTMLHEPGLELNHTSSDLSLDSSTVFDDDEDKNRDDHQHYRTCLSRKFMDWFDLSADVSFDPDDGTPYFDESSKWTFRGIVRALLYNPVHPEFTSLQQFSWAVLIGIFMGMYTAVWKLIIESCVDFMWKDVPEKLLRWGVFTDLDGSFPVYHYMWIVPSMFGGILSFIFAALPTPIPGQNEWIHSLHSRGVQDFETFGMLFVLSTAGMTSGLSLGPELPLILTAGMIGSWLAILCKQSMLQARVLNLTAASAAIGGFFGFPMAGALFVLEIPHRMGLQYFEALTPATIASIVAVLTNRLATGNDVTGYYEYPFLNETLPSHIFKEAIIYGLFGCALGIFYTKLIITLKHFVHDLFHVAVESGDTDRDEHSVIDSSVNYTSLDEALPLIGKTIEKKSKTDAVTDRLKCLRNLFSGRITHEPTRAAFSGWVVGFVVGTTCIFIPHVQFWGEAQLQSMIDKGRTPLPVFGSKDEPTGGLVALGFCMGDHQEDGSVKSGFSLGCSATIVLAKIFVTGLSLGTGIIGGHFWAPLFIGCAAAHFVTDLAGMISSSLGFSSSLSAYPCVALLCIMGSAHVVAFRAHIAIILILTLTISAFDPEDDAGEGLKVAGDYSAVFPLLTVAVFVALQLSRRTVFYEKQRSRGDIMALPEVLCEPGKEGRPLVMDYEGNLHELDECDYEYETDEDSIGLGDTFSMIDSETTLQENVARFETGKLAGINTDRKIGPVRSNSSPGSSSTKVSSIAMVPSPLPPRPNNDNRPRRSSIEEFRSLDELLKAPVEKTVSKRTTTFHRRTMSEPFKAKNENPGSAVSMGRKSDGGITATNKIPKPIALKRVSSYGEVDQEQPCLLEQARRRAASFASRPPPVRKNTS